MAGMGFVNTVRMRDRFAAPKKSEKEAGITKERKK